MHFDQKLAIQNILDLFTDYILLKIIIICSCVADA